MFFVVNQDDATMGTQTVFKSKQELVLRRADNRSLPDRRLGTPLNILKRIPAPIPESNLKVSARNHLIG